MNSIKVEYDKYRGVAVSRLTSAISINSKFRKKIVENLRLKMLDVTNLHN